MAEKAAVEFIYPPNNLKQKQRLAGVSGTLDPIWLEKAEQSIAAVKGDYLTGVNEDLAKLSKAYDAAYAAGAERNKRIEELYAVVQGIKGQGGSFGYPLITGIGSQLCHFIEQSAFAKEDGSLTDAQMEVVKLHTEAMRLVILQKMEGEGGAAGPKLMAGLGMAIKKVTGQA